MKLSWNIHSIQINVILITEVRKMQIMSILI